MNDQSTNWYLRLMDHVTSPLKKIMDVAFGAQKKITDISTATQKITASQNVMGRDFKNNLTQLTARLETLRGLQEKAFTVKHIQNYNKAIKQTEAEIKRINDVINPPHPPLSMWAALKNDLGGLVSQIPGASNVIGLLKNPLALAASAMLTVGISSTTMAANFETGVAKINATAQLGERQLRALDSRLTDIGSHSGGNFERIPETYEKILSVTGKVNQALDLTELAVKGAKAGFTDLDVVGNALARTMNVIQDKTVSAANVLDMLMMAKNVGAGEFQDFAQYIPGLIASAQPAGYTHKDAIGLFSTLSKSFEGSDASMYAQNLFTAFKKTDIIYGLEKAGIKVFQNGFRRPINDVLMDLAKLQKSMNPELFTNFMDAIKLKDAQAATAIGTLTSNTANLKEVFDGLNRSIGETDRQMQATMNTARGWADIGDELKSWGKNIGDFLLPIIDVLVQGVSGFARGLKEIFTGNFFGLFNKADWQGGEEEIKKNARFKNSIEIAERRTREYYHLSPTATFNREQNTFYSSIFHQNQKAINDLDQRERNKIVSDEKEAKGVKSKKAEALFNANNGIAMAEDAMKDNKAGKNAGGSGGGGNKGPTSLTMNIEVHNHFETTKENDTAIKRKITDIIVDAGRDGLVTLGV
jgi:TP901 family phage tail tape measure protein